jgi:hypothetical protein
VAGQSAGQAAEGLFAVNLSMLLAFLSWGVLMPRLARSGLGARHAIVWGMPPGLAVLAWIVVLGAQAGAPHWALWCVLCTCVSLSQPAVAQVFPPAWAGRALSAFNLLVFGGVFCVQWGIGLAIDGFAALGWERAASFRGAVGALGLCCAAAYLWFMWRQRRMAIINSQPVP